MSILGRKEPVAPVALPSQAILGTIGGVAVAVAAFGLGGWAGASWLMLAIGGALVILAVLRALQDPARAAILQQWCTQVGPGVRWGALGVVLGPVFNGYV